MSPLIMSKVLVAYLKPKMGLHTAGLLFAKQHALSDLARRTITEHLLLEEAATLVRGSASLKFGFCESLHHTKPLLMFLAGCTLPLPMAMQDTSILHTCITSRVWYPVMLEQGRTSQ